MSEFNVSLDKIEEARQRIRPYVRHTPLAPLPHLPGDLHSGFRLKLENLQVTGSFKARGVFNTLLQLSADQRFRGVVTSSGGNHGLAVAYATRRLHIPSVVYLPESASPDRVQRVREWSDEVVQHGVAWDDAHAKALERAAADGLYYIHPFDAEATIAGQGTIGLEILEDVPEADCVLIAIGGGGLIAGAACALKQAKPDLRIVGVEPVGAACMERAVSAGRVVELSHVNTIADTLAPRSVSERTLALTRRYVDEIVLVSDAEMIEGMQWLWKNYNQLVEPSGAAVIAAAMTAKFSLSACRHPVAIICGGNARAESVWSSYREDAAARV